jgi:hypothetical protein
VAALVVLCAALSAQPTEAAAATVTLVQASPGVGAQLSLALWGLWRWRRTRPTPGTNPAGSPGGSPAADGVAEPDRDDPWVTPRRPQRRV